MAYVSSGDLEVNAEIGIEQPFKGESRRRLLEGEGTIGRRLSGRSLIAMGTTAFWETRAAGSGRLRT